MNEFGHLVGFALDAIWKVALVGLVLGAGLPALFAFGVRASAWGTSDAGAAGSTATVRVAPNPVGKVVAALVFAVVAYAVVTAILYIVASGQGMTISVSHLVPVFVEKS